MAKDFEIKIRECITLEEFTDCVRLQNEVFALPEVEISPVRHFIVTYYAGGFTLGVFHEDVLIGFSLSIPAILRGEKAFYSHMTAIDKGFHGLGIGSKLKWEQRKKSLEKGVKLIKWTFQPVMARNAFFNLEKLGAVVNEYKPNFYGTDYATLPEQNENKGLDSDRLFAEWHLKSEKVSSLANGESFQETREVVSEIETVNNWGELCNNDLETAIKKQEKIKQDFQTAFKQNFVCKGFKRDLQKPKYLLFRK